MSSSGWGPLLRHQWITVLIGLVVTAGLAVGVMRLSPATYLATSQMVLLPPPASSGTGINPYMGLGDLQNMAVVVSRGMTDGDAERELAEQGVSNGYTADYDPSAAAPILVLTVEEATAADAKSSLERIQAEVPAVLSRLQSSVGAQFQITASLIGSAGNPQLQWKSQLRAVIVVVVLGLTLTLFAAALIESWARRRREARAELLAAQLIRHSVRPFDEWLALQEEAEPELDDAQVNGAHHNGVVRHNAVPRQSPTADAEIGIASEDSWETQAWFDEEFLDEGSVPSDESEQRYGDEDDAEEATDEAAGDVVRDDAVPVTAGDDRRNDESD